MSNGASVFWIVVFVALMVLGIASCSITSDACRAAGGIVQYEYKQMPSCWTKDGRRLFPGQQ